MIVKQIWTGNNYRNYNYLIACAETGEALAIDPLDHEKCLSAAKVRGWQITQLLNTHEHHDHTGGNDAIVAAPGAKVIAHHKAGGKIAGMAPVDTEDTRELAEHDETGGIPGGGGTMVVARVDGTARVSIDQNVTLGVHTHRCHFFDRASGAPLR